MHDCYTFGTLLEKPTSIYFGTWWMGWHSWDTWLIKIHDCGTWFLVEAYHEWYGTCLRHMVGMLLEAYGWYTPLMISYGIWYGIDVHGYCASLAHDVLGWCFVHDSLFIVDIYFASWCMVWHEFDKWTGPRIVIEREVDLCSGWEISFTKETYCNGSILFIL